MASLSSLSVVSKKISLSEIAAGDNTRGVEKNRRIPQGNCRHCIARHYCLPQYLNDRNLSRYEALIRHKTLHRGDRLFQQGEAFRSLYVVHSGSFKAYMISDDGEHQITGFHFQGEILGLDGVGRGEQVYNVDALETASVCELPYHAFEKLMAQVPELHKEFIRAASRELAREKSRMMVLGKMHAERKLAEFFLDLERTLYAKGKPLGQFTLSMTRHDIANYLGLAVETVSRLLTRFQLAGIVTIQRRNVRIVDREKLQSLLKNSKNAHLILDKIA